MKKKNPNVELERALMGPETPRKENVSKRENRWRYVYISTLILCAGIALSAIGIAHDKAHGVGRYSYNYIEETPEEEKLITFESYEEETVPASAPISNTDASGTVETINETTEVWYAPDWYDITRMSYMDFRTITAPETLQYQLQNDGLTITDPVTGIRKRADRYMIALGQEFGLTGTEVDVHLKNGVVIPCIIGDSKEYFDTVDGEGRIGNDGGIVEFIVDEGYLPEEVVWLGSNEAQFNFNWQSPVEYIEIY